MEDLPVSSRKKKPKNRFEGLVKPAFKEAIEYLKDAYDAIGIDEISFKTGPPIVRAFYQDLKKDERKAKQKYPELYRKHIKGEKLYNEGGTVMKDQMEMAFMQEGGLRDDGMDVDPVSGNDVPPGSMASEVRDDIPAQLSEGEYVVPADVVQYYGVKFFEELRMDAKRGLADMESNGRIGGEPMDMPPSDMNQGGMMQGNEQTMPVDTGVGYNVGGVTSNPYNDPTKMDQQVSNVMADNPQNMDMQNRTQAMMSPEQMDQANPPPPPRGMNTGGVVPMPPYNVAGLTANQASGYDYVTNPFNPSTGLNPIFATPGATYMAPPSPSQMVPPTGGVDSSVPSEENCAKMGMDFDPVANMCVPRAAAQTPQQGGGGSDDGDPFANMPKPDPDAWMEDYDYVDMDELAKQTGAALSSESFLPGPLGTFEKGTKMAHSAAHIILLQAQGENGKAEELIKQWESARTGALKLTPFEFINGDRFAIQAAGEHGIKLDRDMKHWKDGKALFKDDKDYEKYLAKYEVSVRERRKREAEKRAAAQPEYIDTSTKDPVSVSTTFKKAGDTGTETAALRRQIADRDDSGRSNLERMMDDARARSKSIQEAAKKSNQSIAKTTQTGSGGYGKSTSATKSTGGKGDLGKGSGRGGMNKGGLMKKKKK